jgi:hypothetical protein
MNQIRGRKKPGARFVFGIAAGLFVVIFTGAIGVLAIVPAVSPAAGAQIADVIRSVAGPQPVAALETVSFNIQDTVNRFMSNFDGGKKTISLAQNNPVPTNTIKRQKVASVAAPAASASGNVVNSPTVSDNVVSAAPQIGWQAYGPLVDNSPVMAQTLLSLDPQRPYAGIALVRIDLSKLKLHMMPGFLEPSHSKDVISAFPNLGTTPASDLKNIIAGFNGGFKAVNGNYGMMVNGVSILPPINGLATVAIYKDGHIALGAWGQDIVPSNDMVAFRQNCPPIILNGQINSQVYVDNPVIWGNTIGNKEITWRTGLGLTQDGRYLIYAVGNGTTVETLAQALQQAGAYNAMQLDINRHYAHFVTYTSTGSADTPLKAVQLLDQMESDPTLYLIPHSRDYFYLTTQ